MKTFKTYILVFSIVMLFYLMLSGLEKTTKKYKYTIKTESSTYRTNSFEKLDGGCVEFVNQCGCGGKSKGSKTRVCGNYTIENNN